MYSSIYSRIVGNALAAARGGAAVPASGFKHYVVFFAMWLGSSLFSAFANAGVLTDITVQASSDTAGALANYTVSFTTSAANTLPSDGKIKLTFPSGFDLSLVAVASGALNLDGALTPSLPSDSVLILTRDKSGKAVPVSTPTGVIFSIVRNRTTANTNLKIKVETQDFIGTPIDAGLSAAFSVVPGALHHFTVTNDAGQNIAAQIAGKNFIIQIKAKDAFDNVVTSFASAVTLDDSTHTISPKNVPDTPINGVVSANVQITKVQSNTRIIATGNGRTGSSNSFTVTHNNLAKFGFSSIGNQVAGIPFAVTFTAQDDKGNTVTNYNGTVKIEATTGNVLPTNSQAFVNGVATESVRFTTIVSKEFRSLKVTDNASSITSSSLPQFLVSPGEPSGEIKLVANPNVLPADGVSKATIKTPSGANNAIKDSEGNSVGNGKLFTVVVSDASVGKIITADADPVAPGLQVATTAASQLNFEFQAGQKGGVATIVVTGGASGSATGQVTISVNELRILSVQAERDTVSARDKNGPSEDQDSVRVNMVVQNAGQNPIALTKADLRFKDANGQTVQDHFFVKLESPLLPAPVPGNFQTLNVSFSVLIDEDASGAYTIDGIAEAENGTISDTTANVTEQWFVQSPPKIAYLAGSLAPKTASLGSSYQFYVRVRNSGQARLVLDTDKTLLRVLGEGGNTLLAKLDANGVLRVAPGDTTLKFQGLFIPTNFPIGRCAAAIDIVGTHNAVPYSLSNILLPDSVTVKQAAELEIVNIIPSQTTVTQNMGKDWSITVKVRNNTGSTMMLDDVNLEILAGGKVDATYQIESPNAFLHDGGSVNLEPDSTGSLLFKILTTGSTKGPAAVAAYVSTTILGELYEAQSIGTQGSFLVQSPAALKIALLPSQPRVTQSQTTDWLIAMRVTNTGESDVNVQFGSAATNLLLASNTGYNIDKPLSLDGNPPNTIRGSTTRDLVFTVDTTGADLGVNTINGSIDTREINSNRRVTVSTVTAGGDTSVIVETPARVVIDSTYLANVFNGEHVNVDQQFHVRVKIKNLGEEKLAGAWVKLATNGNSAIANEVIAAQGDSAVFEVTAANDLRVDETFTATIDSSVAANTKTKALVDPPNDDKAQIDIDTPSSLRLVGITTDLPRDTVAANTTEPWRVFVIVRAVADSGNTILDPPPDLSLDLGGINTDDYTIDKPAGLKRGGLLLRSGQRDTLVYTVRQTGRKSGDLTISAKITGKDQNDYNHTFTRTGAKKLYVEGKTLTQIFKARFASTVNQSGNVGLANLGQKIPVEVDVLNLGPEQIEWAVVSLAKAGGNGEALVVNPQDTIRSIPNTSVATATFLIDAGNLQSAGGDFEVFEARIDTARTLANAAKIGHASPDTTVRLKIETPALLQMSATTDPPGNDLSKGQTFKIRATVNNIGQAQFDNSGRLQIVAPFPPGYTIFDNTPQSFSAASLVEWTVNAPNNVSTQDTFLIKMITRPQDQNARTPVLVEKDTVSLIVNVHESLLTVAQTVIQEPAGATDSLVSTEQRFVLKAKIEKSPNISAVRAEFKPANGYVLADTETRVKTLEAGADSVVWRVIAPSNEDLTPADLKVLIDGKDTSGQPVPADSMSLPVRVQARANLRLTPAISDPVGAAGGILSIGQKFTLLAELNNNGSADTYGEARVRLDLGNSGITLDEGETEEKVLTIAAGVDHGQVTWQVQAPDTVSASKPISFTVTQFPKDVNTDAAASIEKKTVQMIVSTVDQGTIMLSNVRIHEPEGAKDGTLSTEQVFTITADLAWNRADSVKARLLLPPGGFVPESLDDDLERVFAQTQGGTSPFWRIKAPTQTLDRAVFKIDFTATDASNPTLKLGPRQDSLALKFVPRAELSFRVEVSNPEAARDRVVSVGQAFEITAVLENTGEAQVVGADSIRLLPLPEGYRLDGRENTFVKSSAAVGNQRRASWWIIAPNEKSKNPPGETFALRLQNLPLDENTAQSARVDDRERQTTVLTEEKRLQVRKMELDRRPPAARGQDSLAVLCLELKNTGAGENSSNILLRRVQLYVSMPDGAPLAPGTILRSLQIVAAKNHSQVFGKLEVSPALRSNPIVLEFETPVPIGFETPQVVKVLASLTNTDSVEAFSIGFQSSTDLLAKDQDSDSLVAVEDGEGRTGAAFEISSGPAVLFNATFDEFYNYPNPLNLGQGTSFIYTLQQDSNVSLEIYTLLGELVWKKKYTSAEAQGKAGPHDGDIVWDGRNGNGKPVLNGVYLAVLKTNGGTVVTKVAVIK